MNPPLSTSPNLRCRRARIGGAHQFRRPSSVIVAGTSRQRTSVASIATAAASPRPICSTELIRAAPKQPITTTISIAAEVMTLPVCWSPQRTAVPGATPASTYSLTRASRNTS
ncbi:hypothetical protein Pa4123_13050 [Phytohabitans aurantiacus]|uniref:Uncharacterized protein n=1 Tax=Phytohabitans aurantiacus TaxID=3016789 RepID=A0ABQ5QP69_9ACTN|nr:hypothetical protein Pa4123_13050 [Phytohabitans aurantiacus]